MSTCRNARMLWVPGFAKMEPGDLHPGSHTGLVTHGMIERMKAGLLGDEQRSLIRAGRYLRIDCGRCSSCLFKAVMAKTGAMLNESVYSGDVAFLTMTYRPDVPGGDRRADMADKVLTPPHIRTFRERLRRDSHYGKFRSLIVGEYGDLRGRAHWHAILWAEGGESLPEFPHDERFEFKHWPHGHCFARPDPGQASFQYVAGYALKSLLTADIGSGPRPSQLYMTASRRPVLGHQVFRELAERAAEYLVPPSFNYLPPGGDRKYNYTMKDRARDLYVDAYLDRLALVAPDDATFSALSLPLTQMPRGVAFRGAAVDGGPDVWMHKAILEGLVRREARLNPVPPAVSAEADLAEMVADLRDKQSRQERINRLEEEKRLAADLRRSNERRKRLDAERRVAGEVQRLKEWAERLNPPRLHDPADPFEEDAALWDDFSADRYSVDLVRSGAWRLD